MSTSAPVPPAPATPAPATPALNPMPAPTPLTLAHPSLRARLIPLAPEHHAELLAAAQEDPAIFRFMPNGPYHTPEAMHAFIARALQEQADASSLPFAVVDTRGCEHWPANTIVGSTRYMAIDRPNHALEIGATWYRARAQRTAINTACKLLLLTHAFETLLARRVFLKTDLRNERSQTAIARIGGVREGVFRQDRRLPDGTWRDTVYFSIIAPDWPAVRANLLAMLAR